MTNTNDLVKGERYTVVLFAGGGVVDAAFVGDFGELAFRDGRGSFRSFAKSTVREFVPAFKL